MTKTFSQEEIQQAHDLKTTIEAGFKNYESGSHYSYQTVGAALAAMRDGKAYKTLGFKNMDGVIKDIGKSRSICYAMMDYHDIITPALGEYPDLIKMSVTDLCKYVVPYIRAATIKAATGELAETFESVMARICEICNLPASEMDDEIGRLRGKTPKIDCEHETTEPWVRCSCCNKFIKVTV